MIVVGDRGLEGGTDSKERQKTTPTAAATPAHPANQRADRMGHRCINTVEGSDQSSASDTNRFTNNLDTEMTMW